MFRFSSSSRSAGRRCAGVWALAVVGGALLALLALVVALALDVQQQRLFGLRLQAALALYVLLAAAVLLWLARRVAAVQPAREGQALAQRVEPRLE